MDTKNANIIEETFYLGATHVRIVNPNSYFPENLTEYTKTEFFTKNSELFNAAFHALAAASRDAHTYEHSFEFQKQAIQKYLETITNKQIMAETGLSNKTVSELKNHKKSLETSAFKTIEKLYTCARRQECLANSQHSR